MRDMHQSLPNLHLQREDILTHNAAKFYCASLLLSLEVPPTRHFLHFPLHQPLITFINF